VREFYKGLYGDYCFKENIPLKLSVLTYYPIPKATSQKKQEQMLKKEIRPTIKPDVDNILKIIADALNGVAYYDDKQIVAMSCEKFYANMPHVVVTVEDIEEVSQCQKQQ
jgi:Holliday junction resolvase RusA-like endonuclease